MAKDAIIRVRLDTSGAKADLNDLYTRMRGAPGIGGGGGGGGGRGGGGAGGAIPGLLSGRGMNVGGMIAGAMGMGPAGLIAAAVATSFIGPTVMTAGKAVGQMLKPAGAAIEYGLLGNLGANMTARGRVTEEVQGQMGLAVGLGVADVQMARSLREAVLPIRQAEEQGKAEIGRAFGVLDAVENLKDIGGHWGSGFRMLGRMLGKGGA